MKRNQFFFLSVFTLLNLFAVQAQTDPGKTNLKHQWTFDNGSATDNVAGLIASRIYKVRNAIVHSKKQTFGAFIPFKHDRALSYEIPLVKCVAEEVIDNNSSRV